MKDEKSSEIRIKGFDRETEVVKPLEEKTNIQ